MCARVYVYVGGLLALRVEAGLAGGGERGLFQKRKQASTRLRGAQGSLSYYENIESNYFF